MANTKPRVGANPLAYQGVRAINPPDFVKAARDPLQNVGAPINPLDYNHDLGTLWLNTTTQNVFMLVSKTPSPIATWIQFNAAVTGPLDALLDDGALQVVPTVGGDITILGDAAAGLSSTRTGANTLTISTNTGNPFLQTLTGNAGGAVAGDAVLQNIGFTGNLANGLNVVGNPGANTLEIQSRGGNRFIEILTGSSNPGTDVTGTAADGTVQLESTSAGLTITGDAGNNKIVFTLLGGGGSGGIQLQDNAGLVATPDGSLIIKVQGLTSRGLETQSQIDQTGAPDLNAMVITTVSGNHIFESLTDNVTVITETNATGNIDLVGLLSAGLRTFSGLDEDGNAALNSMAIGLVNSTHIVEGLIPDVGPTSPVRADGSGDITISGGVLINTDGPAANTLRINLDQGLDGQVIIGATGLNPVYGNITSFDGTIVVTNGPNSINLSAPGGGGAGVLTVTGNSGGAIAPAAGNLGLVGQVASGILVAGNVPGANSLQIQSVGGNRFIETFTGDQGGPITGSLGPGNVNLKSINPSLLILGTAGFNLIEITSENANPFMLSLQADSGTKVGGKTTAPDIGNIDLIAGAGMTISGNAGNNTLTFVSNAAQGVIVTKFTASGNFIKNPNTRMIKVMAVGGGNGGGSGGRGAGTGNEGGGGGGGSGAFSVCVPVDVFAANETVTIGAGGAGGVGNGVDGTIGGVTSLGLLRTPSNNDTRGRGGNTTATSIAVGQAAGVVDGVSLPTRFPIPATPGPDIIIGIPRGGTKDIANNFGAPGQDNPYLLGGGAAGGGSIGSTFGPGVFDGGAGGDSVSFEGSVVLIAGGIGGVAGANGGNGNAGWGAIVTGGTLVGGTGGGGGGWFTGQSGDGGNGGIPGGSGGGGAGSNLTAPSSGDGGNGARGELWVIEYI